MFSVFKMYIFVPVPVLDLTNTSLPASREGMAAFCTLWVNQWWTKLHDCIVYNSVGA